MEDNSNQELIPAFNPESFLDEANEISIGTNFKYNPEENQQQNFQNQNQDQEEKKNDNDDIDIDFDDDFLNIQKKPKEDVFNPEDYSVLSKTLGVEIKTKEDLEKVQSKFRGEEEAEKNKNPEKSNYNFLPEEQEKFSNLNKALEGAKNASSEDLMKWYLKQTNTNIDYENNPEELDYHIDTLKETGIFNSQEKEVRAKLIADITEQQNKLVSISEKREQENTIAVNRELEQEIKKYKQGFHGINLTPKDLFETFDSIKNGSIFQEIESSQANVAEMAILWKNKELFYKAFENPDTSAGVKKMMEELQNSKAKPAVGNNTLKSPYVFNPEAFLNSDVKIVSSQ